MKFNLSFKAKKETTNYMGATAYKLTPEMELYTAVATCMVDDSYYEKKEDRLNRIKELIGKCTPEFVSKLAVYARTEMNLRSIPVLLTVELAKTQAGTVIGKTVNSVVQRADEITEMLAYYQVANGRKYNKKLNRLSKQLQKGLAASFNKFDEYQFGKYNRAGSDVKLRDALFLVHPKAKDEAQQALFDKIASDTLATPYTWETEMSELGKENFSSEKAKQKAVAEKWEELVLSGKMGYMAVLRNLRNILAKGTNEAFDEALAIIASEQKIKKAKQLPFRYLSAFLEMEKLDTENVAYGNAVNKVQRATKALEKALLISCNNIRVNQGTTAVLSDNSGSMYGDAAGKSLVTAMSNRKTADIANLFAVLYWNQNRDTYIGLFGDRLVNPDLNRKVNLFENFKQINQDAKKCGPGTERGIFDYMESLISQKTIVDRIIVFSDCQVGKGCNWYDNKGNRGDNFDSLLEQYRKINPDVKVYSVDLKGYGNSMTTDNVNTVLVSGWSEKIFDMIYYIENGSSAVEEINKIVL